MQYENVFKGDKCCSCYTCLPKSSPTAQTAVKMVAAQTAQTHDRNAKTSPAHTHTCKQRQTLRNSTIIHKNSKHQAKTVLRITTIAWT